MPSPLNIELQYGASEYQWRRLLRVGGFTPAGLEDLRWQLRGPEWAGLPAPLRERKGVLLDAVCRELERLEPGKGWLAHAAGVGDLLVIAPDDLSSLEPGE